MRNTSQGATLASFKYIPEPTVIELDDEAGRIAFAAAERELSAKGFADMDLMGQYATQDLEGLK